MNVQRYELEIYHCNGGEMLVSETGDYVSHDDYAALEAKCEALAAENLALMQQTPDVRSASMFEAIEKAEKLIDDGMPELAMVEAFEILKMKRTPATDAFLAEVRASGVEMLRDSIANIESGTENTIDLHHYCTDFAAQIRQETAQ